MKKLIVLLLAASPLAALAQNPITNLNEVASKASQLGNLVIGLTISIAVLWIIVNTVIYLIATNDPAKRAQGGHGILFGVVGLFVILSIWGLVAILRNTFGTQDQRPDADIRRTTDLPDPRYIRDGAYGGASTNSNFQINPNPGGAGYSSDFNDPRYGGPQ